MKNKNVLICFFLFLIHCSSYAQSKDSVAIFYPDSIKNYRTNIKYININKHLFLPNCCGEEGVILEISSIAPTKVIDSGAVYQPLKMLMTFKNNIPNGPIKLFCRYNNNFAVEGFMKDGKENGVFTIWEYHKNSLDELIKLPDYFITYQNGMLHGPSISLFTYLTNNDEIKIKVHSISLYKNNKLKKFYSQSDSFELGLKKTQIKKHPNYKK